MNINLEIMRLKKQNELLAKRVAELESGIRITREGNHWVARTNSSGELKAGGGSSIATALMNLDYHCKNKDV